MKLHSLLLILGFFLLSSCSSLKNSQKNLYEDKVTFVKNKDDTISLSSTLDLARASYLRGCMEEMKVTGQNPNFDYCLNKAKAYVKDDVIFILNQ